MMQPPVTATIAFVDVVESVRHVQRDETGSIQRMRALMRAAAEQVVQHHGVVVERLGDGLVLRFDNVPSALRCSQALHQLAEQEGVLLPQSSRMQLRAGIHSAAVWSDADGLYGMGVNLTARVAAMGGPGDTVLTAAARDHMVVGLHADLQDLGLCYLKHVEQPQRLFRVQQAKPLSPGLAQAIAARMKTRPTVAVLPLALDTAPLPGTQPNMQPLGLADVIGHQLTALLSRSPMLHVISALSAAAFRSGQGSMAQLYHSLGVDYVLKGRLLGASGKTHAADALQLDVQLWRQGSSEPVWADVVQAKPQDALSTQSDPLGRIAHAASHRILAVEQRLARGAQSLPNLPSHTLYLNAVDLLHRFSLTDFERARQMLLALADRAPRHPDPLAWLARWHVFRVVQGWTDDSARDSNEALSYSERALDRDPESALALTMAGSVYAGVKRDPGQAQRLYEQALAANPNESMAWVMSGVAQGFLSIRDSALAASETGLGLAPLDPLRYYYDSLSASAALMSGETQRAIELAQRAIDGNAGHGSAFRVLAAAMVFAEQVEEARAAIERMLAVEPHFTVATYLNRVSVDNAKNREIADALRLAGLPEK